jgi:DNA-binding transcriptional MerR regulator
MYAKIQEPDVLMLPEVCRRLGITPKQFYRLEGSVIPAAKKWRYTRIRVFTAREVRRLRRILEGSRAVQENPA